MLNTDGELPPEFPVSKLLAQVLQQKVRGEYLYMTFMWNFPA